MTQNLVNAHPTSLPPSNSFPPNYDDSTTTSTTIPAKYKGTVDSLPLLRSSQPLVPNTLVYPFLPRTQAERSDLPVSPPEREKKCPRVWSWRRGELQYLLPTITTDLAGEQWRDWTWG